MLVLDMVLISVVMLIVENKMLREKYILFSPYTLGQFVLLYIYILPFLFYGHAEVYSYVSRLSTAEVNLFLVYLRVFYYMFTILSLISFNTIRKSINVKEKIKYKLNDSFLIITVFLLIGIVLLGELRIVNFNLSILFDKMINPRKYTYFREGLGMFTHLVSFSTLMLLYLSIIYYNQRKGLIAKIILIFSILFNVLGGSKSSLLIILIYSLVLSQKISIKIQVIKFRKLIIYAGIMFLLVTFSFMLMRTSEDRSTFMGAVNGIIGYSQEAYYSARVINDFEWEDDHLATVVEGLIFTPIPRSIFPSKGYYGLYNNHWRPLYQSNTVQYHTSTYGFLAEGHMLFSFFSPIIYAFLFNWLFKKMYVKFYRITRLSSLFFLVYVVMQIYFLMRTGLFMTTNVWILIIYYVASKLFFSLMNIFNIRIEDKTVS